MYGNYIDEPVMTYSGGIYFYVQDHLYSTAALVDAAGAPQERYEYDAYGQVHILDANFADDADGRSDCNNPYMFTGRRVDFLDGGKLTLQINRHRYYDYYTGRWLTEDPLGVGPQFVVGEEGMRLVGSTPVLEEDDLNALDPHDEAGSARVYTRAVVLYATGLNLYEYANSDPVKVVDAHGFWGRDVHYVGTKRWSRLAGYIYGGCSEILGRSCNYVDSDLSGKSPKPWGDFRCHFDTDKEGNNFVMGARDGRIAEHSNNAKAILTPPSISYETVGEGLKEVGTALHPLQDKFSHSITHQAITPLWHAPKWWCRYKTGMPLSSLMEEPSNPWFHICLWHSENNPNWGDSHRPDKVEMWESDFLATGTASKAFVKQFLDYPCVCARCKLGRTW